jgi:hypothetical protein
MNNSLFEPRNILFIKDYQFDDGSKTAENEGKLSIILDVEEQYTWVIQVLTTSQQKVPDDKVNHGCTNSKDGLFSFYCFEENRQIGTTPNQEPFAFHKTTFVLFQSNTSQISTQKYIEYMNENKISLKAILDKKEYKRLLKCLLSSRFLVRKLKPRLQSTLDNLNDD